MQESNETVFITQDESTKTINQILHGLINIISSRNKSNRYLFLNHTDTDIGPYIFEGIPHDYSGHYVPATITQSQKSKTIWKYHNPIDNLSNTHPSLLAINNEEKYDIIFGIFPYGIQHVNEEIHNLRKMKSELEDIRDNHYGTHFNELEDLEKKPPPTYEIIELNRKINEVEKQIRQYPKYMDLQKTSLALDSLSNEGIAIFFQPIGHTSRKGSNNIRSIYANKNCYLNAILTMPKNGIFEIPGGRPSGVRYLLSIVTKKLQPIELIAELESFNPLSEKVKTILTKLQTLFDNGLSEVNKLEKTNSAYNNLTEGIFIPTGRFEGLDAFKYYKNLETEKQLGPDYVNYETLTISDVSTEINIGNSRKNLQNRDNALYIPLLAGLQKCETDLDNVHLKHQNVCQIIFNTEKILPGYAKNYFNSPLGLEILQERRSYLGNFILKLNKKAIEELRIRVLPINIQKEISETASIMEEVIVKVNEITGNLIANPISSQDEKDKLINIHNVVTNVGNSTKIKHLSKQVENEQLEFKSTFGLDFNTMKKEKHMEENISKAVSGFLNNKGGNLLIGVKDDNSVIGIDQEVDILYQSNWDKFSRHVSNILSNKLGKPASAFYTQTYVSIDNVKVLWIQCFPSTKEVFVNNKTFYIRQPAQTIALEGQDLIDYVKSRFHKD